MIGGYSWVLEMTSKTTYWLELKRTLKLDRSYAFLRTQDVGMDLSTELGAESLRFPIIGFLQKAFYSHLFSAHSRSGRMSDYQNLVSATWSLSSSRPEFDIWIRLWFRIYTYLQTLKMSTKLWSLSSSRSELDIWIRCHRFTCLER